MCLCSGKYGESRGSFGDSSWTCRKEEHVCAWGGKETNSLWDWPEHHNRKNKRLTYLHTKSVYLVESDSKHIRTLLTSLMLLWCIYRENKDYIHGPLNKPSCRNRIALFNLEIRQIIKSILPLFPLQVKIAFPSSCFLNYFQIHNLNHIDSYAEHFWEFLDKTSPYIYTAVFGQKLWHRTVTPPPGGNDSELDRMVCVSKCVSVCFQLRLITISGGLIQNDITSLKCV